MSEMSDELKQVVSMSPEERRRFFEQSQDTKYCSICDQYVMGEPCKTEEEALKNSCELTKP